jgi:hypothetical protein
LSERNAPKVIVCAWLCKIRGWASIPRSWTNLRRFLFHQETRYGHGLIHWPKHYRESSWPCLGYTQGWPWCDVLNFYSLHIRWVNGGRCAGAGCHRYCARHEGFVTSNRLLISVVDVTSLYASRYPTCCESSALRPSVLVAGRISRLRLCTSNQLSDPRHRHARHDRTRSPARIGAAPVKNPYHFHCCPHQRSRSLTPAQTGCRRLPL